LAIEGLVGETAMDCSVAAVTVNVAGALVTFPVEFNTTTVKTEPVSLIDVVGVV
jgi:hypothetical protein